MFKEHTSTAVAVTTGSTSTSSVLADAHQAGAVALDSVTILVADANHRAAKRFSHNLDGSIRKEDYDAGYRFGVLEGAISGIEDLSALLVQLEPNHRAFVIRGARRAKDDSGAPIRRLKENFSTPAQGRYWILIDLDKIALPSGITLEQGPKLVCEHLVSLLPEEFHGCSYHFQLSASAGMGDPRKVSVHLWFWLEEPWSDVRLKRWAEAVNVSRGAKLIDEALFNDVQVHYTAAPIFDGVPDPLPVRSGFVKKHSNAVSIRKLPDVERQAAPPRTDLGDPSTGRTREGGRNLALTSHAGALRRRGLEEPAIHAALKGLNLEICVPPLEDAEVAAIAGSVAKYTAPEIDALQTLNDAGNAGRFVGDWGQMVRFVPELGKWLLWTDGAWKLDGEGWVIELAKLSARRIYEEAAAASTKDIASDLARHAKNSLNERRLKAMVELARTDKALVLPRARLDADPFLLGVTNGVVDLRTGELRAAAPEDYITRQVAVPYTSDAQCPVFERFLTKAMGGNQELVVFLQRIFGYTLTASTEEQCLFFLYGTGANGKSTLLNSMKQVLGGYAKQAAAETLMDRKHGGASNDIARLDGARLVLSNELEDGTRLAETLVKQLTGGDPITARFLYQEHFEMIPTFKLVIAGNHKPVIRGDDHGIWRRIVLIPFVVTIPEDQRDPDLLNKLAAEAPGILAWMVRGCMAWRAQGLNPPPEVQSAVREYRSEMDVLGQWLEARCEIGADREARASDLYRSYRYWAETNGFHPMSNTSFGRKLSERNLEKKKTKDGHVYLGLALKSGDGGL